MAVKNILKIFLKALGLLYLQILCYFFLQQGIGAFFWYPFITVFILLVHVSIVYFLIFKPDFIIDTLNLTKGFDDETISSNISYTSVLSFSIIIVGGVLLIKSLYAFLYDLSNSYRMWLVYKDMHQAFGVFPSFILPLIKIAVAFLLIVEQKRIVNYIVLRKKKVQA